MKIQLSITLSLIMINGLAWSQNPDQKYSIEVQKKIDLVEHNLCGEIKIENAPNYSIEERMKFYGIQGVSIAVINNYQIEWAKGYGFADSVEQRKVTPNTLFQVASMSKSINAVGILKLYKDRQFDLNADINKYLKSWQFPYDSLSDGNKISMLHLLSHTAGISTHGFPGYETRDNIPSLTDILDGKPGVNSQPVRSEFAPGIKCQYSGGGTTISQLILEDQTGKKYADFMQENVLNPLKMTNSFFTQPPPSDKKNLLATGYYSGIRKVKGKYHVYPEQAPAGLWATPTDYAKYVIETQLSLEGKSENIFSKEETMFRLTPFKNDESALGEFIIDKNGVKYFTHGGANEGFFSTHFGSFEEGKGLVIMVNSQADQALIDEIVNSIALTYNWENFYTPILKKEIKLPSNKLDHYCGSFLEKARNEKERGNMTKIIRKKDDLFLMIEEQSKGFLIHFIDDTHGFITEENNVFTFLKNEKEAVTGLQFENGYEIEKTTLPFKDYYLLLETLRETVSKKGALEAVIQYKELKKSNNSDYIFDEGVLNRLGYELLVENKIDEAIIIFKQNVEEYPEGWNVYDSLAEAYVEKGNKKLAIENYEKSIALNPENYNGVTSLKKLK